MLHTYLTFTSYVNKVHSVYYKLFSVLLYYQLYSNSVLPQQLNAVLNCSSGWISEGKLEWFFWGVWMGGVGTKMHNLQNTVVSRYVLEKKGMACLPSYSRKFMYLRDLQSRIVILQHFVHLET